MTTEIKSILEKELPKNSWKLVTKGSHFDGSPYLKIAFAVSDYDINNVRGQKIQCVSLILDLTTLELQSQVFGGNGGQSIYRKPNMEHPREKYLAMKSVKIPFRMPKKEQKFVYNAIRKFAQNWVKSLTENIDELMYQDKVNYKEFLSIK
jgi:hypothetical protein